MNLDINIKRLSTLILIDIKSLYKWLLVSFILLILVLFLVSFFVLFKTFATELLLHMAGTVLSIYFLIGIFITGSAFIPMYNKSKNHFWYMLPASPLEKFIAKLIFHIFIYPLFAILGICMVIYVGNLFFDVISYDLLSTRIQHIFIPQAIDNFSHYIISASIILLGASFFKTKVVLKTIFSIWGFMFVATFVTFIVMRMINPTIFEDTKIFKFNLSNYLDSLPYYVFVIVMVSLWILSYWNIKRIQISSGV